MAAPSALRARLAILLAALILSLGALALIGLGLGLSATASDSFSGAGMTQAMFLVSGSGPGGIQIQLLGQPATNTAIGIATQDLPLYAIGGWLVLVPIALLVAWRLAGRFAGPIIQVTGAARLAGPANLALRVPIDGRRDEMGRLGDAFNDLMDRFERHEHDRRRLVDDAAHEVRNPLAVMRTSLEVALADDGDPDALRAAAEVSQRAAERIARTVDNLHAELRDRAPETARSAVDLADVASELGRDYQAIAAHRGVTIQVMAPSGFIVQADRETLKRALANLMANAIRFAPPGSPVLVGAGGVSGWRWLGVRDFGPGIAGADQPLVFRRGWRGSAQDADDGSGIGLALVRQIAEAHGGSVRLSSAPRAGSSFVIWLPVREDGGQPALPTDAQPDPLWLQSTAREA